MIDPSILIGFLPWIVFAIVSSFLGTKIGAIICLTLQIALFIPMARKRAYTILEAFSLVFFVILAIGFFALGEQSIENLNRWSAALSYGGLALITWATIAIGDPFTRQYARRTTPKEWWTSELFLSSTMSMAVGWAVAFLGATIISVIGALMGFRFIFIHSLAMGCMLLAILWHNRVMAETKAKAKVLSDPGAGERYR
jgi:hypothetical protein